MGSYNSKQRMKLQYLIFITHIVKIVSSLECYVCDDQDGNDDKCIRTIKTCEYQQDRCLSEIRWSTTPYWSQGAEKQYYVSKRCANEAECSHEIAASMHLCHYIWYEDWKCAECCQGDRCDYYVTLGGSNTTSNLHLMISLLFATILYNAV